MGVPQHACDPPQRPRRARWAAKNCVAGRRQSGTTIARAARKNTRVSTIPNTYSEPVPRLLRGVEDAGEDADEGDERGDRAAHEQQDTTPSGERPHRAPDHQDGPHQTDQPDHDEHDADGRRGVTGQVAGEGVVRAGVEGAGHAHHRGTAEEDAQRREHPEGGEDEPEDRRDDDVRGTGRDGGEAVLPVPARHRRPAGRTARRMRAGRRAAVRTAAGRRPAAVLRCPYCCCPYGGCPYAVRADCPYGLAVHGAVLSGGRAVAGLQPGRRARSTRTARSRTRMWRVRIRWLGAGGIGSGGLRAAGMDPDPGRRTGSWSPPSAPVARQSVRMSASCGGSKHPARSRGGLHTDVGTAGPLASSGRSTARAGPLLGCALVTTSLPVVLIAEELAPSVLEVLGRGRRDPARRRRRPGCAAARARRRRGGDDPQRDPDRRRGARRRAEPQGGRPGRHRPGQRRRRRGHRARA